MADGLVKRGHDVTLFASGNSLTAARLVSVFPTDLLAAGLGEPSIYDLVNAAACFERANEFDIIHNHAGLEAMLMANLVDTPVLTTLHRLLEPQNMPIWSSYKGYYNTVSREAKVGLPDKGFAGVIYNAIDANAFPLGRKRDGYLLSLGRICREKGVHHAIEVSKRLNKPLIIAGNVHSYDRDYFGEYVEPHVDGRLIKYVGEVNFAQKRKLYSRADCFLMPIQWREPFGLVIVESMACGTPVVAFRSGAAPELVKQGETGFLVDNVDEMVEAVANAKEIDRRRCREHVLARFHVDRMVDEYIEAYRSIVERRRKTILSAA
ncbi:MAG: glycosyltransferase family 4 protein [Chloroflexi bacterium]|nr:glycosyltransferase family 4 protein [Chloroflexota bacterium]